MTPETATSNEPIVYYIVIVVCELLVGAFEFGGKKYGGVYMAITRIIVVSVAYFFKSGSAAAYYSIFALIGAIYMFDTVGLWISGCNIYPHADSKNMTLPQNGFCFLAFLIVSVTAYLGYMFKLSLDKNIDDEFMDDEHQNFAFKKDTKKVNRFEQFSGQGVPLA